MNQNENIGLKPIKPTKIIRTFSEDFKKSIIKEIETKKLSVKNVSKIYEVSEVAVYKWLWKYSYKYHKGVRMVLELESEGSRSDYLINKLSKAEQTVGKQQIEIEFLKQVLELCSQELGYDVKKKFTTMQSNISK